MPACSSPRSRPPAWRGLLALALVVGGCSSSAAPTGVEAGAGDLAAAVDAAVVVDLAVPGDATSPPDLTVIQPDLKELGDLAALGDFAGEVFPAPHPPLPEVQNAGGRRLLSPRLTSVTFVADKLAPELDGFLRNLPTTPWWTATMAEYGVGAGSTTAPVHVNEAPPHQLDDSMIQTWLRAKLDGSHLEFGLPDGNSLYVIYYPVATAITLGNLASCQGFAAYHSALRIKDGSSVSYAVVARCRVGAGPSAVDALTGPAAHEIAEAATDADPGAPAYRDLDAASFAWRLATGSEVGDLCFFLPEAFYKSNGFDFEVQRTWSNAAARASLDPCVPAPPGSTYFNSAPVLPDLITINGQMMPGIRIAPGHSRTIELDLFSAGPTQPWTVEASTELTNLGSMAQQLRFSFDRSTGANGSKLHLTVEVVKAGPDGYESFAIVSTLGPYTNLWFVAVAPQ